MSHNLHILQFETAQQPVANEFLAQHPANLMYPNQPLDSAQAHYARELGYNPQVQSYVSANDQPQYVGPQSYPKGLTSTPETQGYRAPQVTMVPQHYGQTGHMLPPYYPEPSGYPQPQNSWPSQSYRGIERASGASVPVVSRSPRELYIGSDHNVLKKPTDARVRHFSKSSSDTDKESKLSGRSTRSRRDLHSPSSDSECEMEPD